MAVALYLLSALDCLHNHWDVGFNTCTQKPVASNIEQGLDVSLPGLNGVLHYDPWDLHAKWQGKEG